MLDEASTGALTAVVLAGGLGTRIREVSVELPKPMLPVAGKPFVEHLLLYLARAGVRRVVLSVGHRADALTTHFGPGDSLGLRIEYSLEDEPLGTGGAIRKACEGLNRWPVLVLNGDSFVAVDLGAMLAAHRACRPPLTIALARVDDTGRFGRVRLDAAGTVEAFEEKAAGGPGLVNAGVYLIEREVVARIPAGKSSFEHHVLPFMAGEGAMGFTTHGFFVDIGVPEDYRRLAGAPAAFLRAAASDES